MVGAVTVDVVVDAAVAAVASELGVELAAVDVAVIAVVAETVLAAVSKVVPPLHALTDSATATRVQYLTPERYQLQAADYEVPGAPVDRTQRPLPHNTPPITGRERMFG